MTTWEELITILRSNHFYPDSEIEKGKKVALHINCAPIMADIRKIRLLEVLEENKVEKEFTLRFVGNDNDYIEIKRSKSKQS